MKFINRINDSLFNPLNILGYRKDKFFISFLYLLMLGLLLVIPDVIVLSDQSLIDYQEEVLIRTSFSEAGPIPFKIEDNKLVRLSIDGKIYHVDTESFRIYFSDLDTLPTKDSFKDYYVLFNSEGIYLVCLDYQLIKICKYSDSTLFDNLNFLNATIDNHVFWNSFFQAIKVSSYTFTTYLLSVMYSYLFIQSLLYVIIVILGLSFFTKYNAEVSFTFKEIFKMNTYCATPFVVSTILGVFLNNGVLSFVGLVITIYYSTKISIKRGV